MKIEFSQHVFEKYSNIQFNENPSMWVPRFSIRTDGQTDRYEGANSRFSQFRERAQKSLEIGEF